VKAHLPKFPFQHLALSLSGGGYRAASFHLGLMTYLHSVRWKDTPLLERVHILSTVSGGTFTGVCYATSVAEGRTLHECYSRLYRFMAEVDLIEEGLEKLADYKNWKSKKGRSLINAFSLVYYDKFEKHDFAILFENESHLKEIIFNATEFTYGLPFRFQKTAWSDEHAAYIGNKQVSMPVEAAKEIHLSDIVAASSCFPMGFEPINFPHDFRNENSPILNRLKESNAMDQWGKKCEFPIGLMDGGIDDNQGIDSVINAEKRMHSYEGEMKRFVSEDENAIDLYLISDVASPFMDGYMRTREKKFTKWRKWSFRTFTWSGLTLFAAGALTVFLAFILHHPILVFCAGFLAALLFLLSGLSIFLSNIFNWLLKKFDLPDFFMQRLQQFSTMKFGVYETLIKNRITSVKSMVSEVFMKQIRRQEYGRVYDDPKWLNRMVMCGIYELTGQYTVYRNSRKKELISPDLQQLSQQLMKAAEEAKSMGTTLWFTPGELKEDADTKRSKLNTLIACGQFTCCFNLLEYIENVLWHKDNKKEYDKYPDTVKEDISLLYRQMMTDWHTFNENPFWMVDQINHSNLSG
jgi:hypothetical protein